jgi:hypothetical protein
VFVFRDSRAGENLQLAFEDIRPRAQHPRLRFFPTCSSTPRTCPRSNTPSTSADAKG